MGIIKNKSHEKNHEGKSAHHSPGKHMLHMVLCCGLPILILSMLPYIARISPAASRILGYVAPFICPVMMGLMIFMMFRGNKHSCCEESNDSNKEASGQISGKEHVAD